jgi:hypothetical protein
LICGGRRGGIPTAAIVSRRDQWHLGCQSYFPAALANQL